MSSGFSDLNETNDNNLNLKIPTRNIERFSAVTSERNTTFARYTRRSTTYSKAYKRHRTSQPQKMSASQKTAHEDSSKALSWVGSLIKRGRSILSNLKEEDKTFEKQLREEAETHRLHEELVNNVLNDVDGEIVDATTGKGYGTDTSFKNFDGTLRDSFTDSGASKSEDDIENESCSENGLFVDLDQHEDEDRTEPETELNTVMNTNIHKVNESDKESIASATSIIILSDYEEKISADEPPNRHTTTNHIFEKVVDRNKLRDDYQDPIPSEVESTEEMDQDDESQSSESDSALSSTSSNSRFGHSSIPNGLEYNPMRMVFNESGHFDDYNSHTASDTSIPHHDELESKSPRISLDETRVDSQEESQKLKDKMDTASQTRIHESTAESLDISGVEAAENSSEQSVEESIARGEELFDLNNKTNEDKISADYVNKDEIYPTHVDYGHDNLHREDGAVSEGNSIEKSIRPANTEAMPQRLESLKGERVDTGINKDATKVPEVTNAYTTTHSMESANDGTHYELPGNIYDFEAIANLAMSQVLSANHLDLQAEDRIDADLGETSKIVQDSYNENPRSEHDYNGENQEDLSDGNIAVYTDDGTDTHQVSVHEGVEDSPKRTQMPLLRKIFKPDAAETDEDTTFSSAADETLYYSVDENLDLTSNSQELPVDEEKQMNLTYEIHFTGSAYSSASSEDNREVLEPPEYVSPLTENPFLTAYEGDPISLLQRTLASIGQAPKVCSQKMESTAESTQVQLEEEGSELWKDQGEKMSTNAIERETALNSGSNRSTTSDDVLKSEISVNNEQSRSKRSLDASEGAGEILLEELESPVTPCHIVLTKPIIEDSDFENDSAVFENSFIAELKSGDDTIAEAIEDLYLVETDPVVEFPVISAEVFETSTAAFNIEELQAGDNSISIVEQGQLSFVIEEPIIELPDAMDEPSIIVEECDVYERAPSKKPLVSSTHNKNEQYYSNFLKKRSFFADEIEKDVKKGHYENKCSAATADGVNNPDIEVESSTKLEKGHGSKLDHRSLSMKVLSSPIRALGTIANHIKNVGNVASDFVKRIDAMDIEEDASSTAVTINESVEKKDQKVDQITANHEEHRKLQDEQLNEQQNEMYHNDEKEPWLIKKEEGESADLAPGFFDGDWKHEVLNNSNSTNQRDSALSVPSHTRLETSLSVARNGDGSQKSENTQDVISSIEHIQHISDIVDGTPLNFLKSDFLHSSVNNTDEVPHEELSMTVKEDGEAEITINLDKNLNDYLILDDKLNMDELRNEELNTTVQVGGEADITIISNNNTDNISISDEKLTNDEELSDEKMNNEVSKNEKMSSEKSLNDNIKVTGENAQEHSYPVAVSGVSTIDDFENVKSVDIISSSSGSESIRVSEISGSPSGINLTNVAALPDDLLSDPPSEDSPDSEPYDNNNEDADALSSAALEVAVMKQSDGSGKSDDLKTSAASEVLRDVEQEDFSGNDDASTSNEENLRLGLTSNVDNFKSRSKRKRSSHPALVGGKARKRARKLKKSKSNTSYYRNHRKQSKRGQTD